MASCIEKGSLEMSCSTLDTGDEEAQCHVPSDTHEKNELLTYCPHPAFQILQDHWIFADKFAKTFGEKDMLTFASGLTRKAE